MKSVNAKSVQEVDSHKEILKSRENRKAQGQKKHSSKRKSNVKWYDKWD